MINKTLLKFILILLVILMFLIPFLVWLKNQGALFRLIGLFAFTLIFIQISVGSYRSIIWNKIFKSGKVLKLHKTLGVFALLFALSHPILLILQNKFRFISNYSLLGISLGTLGLLLILISVLTFLIRNKINYKNWHKIHMLNYLAFFLIFTHSLLIGADTKAIPILILWIIYFIIVVIGIILRIKKLERVV